MWNSDVKGKGTAVMEASTALLLAAHAFKDWLGQGKVTCNCGLLLVTHKPHNLFSPYIGVTAFLYVPHPSNVFESQY